VRTAYSENSAKGVQRHAKQDQSGQIDESIRAGGIVDLFFGGPGYFVYANNRIPNSVSAF
jgi:hypothetical protein